MATLGRPRKPVILSDQEREQLESYANASSIPNGLARRFRIILLAAKDMPRNEIAEQVTVSQTTVGNWIKRFATRGIAGLHDELRTGRPRTITDDKIAEVIDKTVNDKPENNRWTCELMAGEAGISTMAISRIWRTFGLKPHRSKTFKLSNDPFFVEKVRDVVGLYLDPPANAVVLSVDEKSQCQALERTQPALPMGFGYVEGYTHDYIRHGTTTLFAALNVATGATLAQCKKRHRHQEFLQFLRHIDANVPEHLDVHVIMDNYSTHKHEKVRTWFARHPRFHYHFTPTYSSWLNQVEGWFSIISRRLILRESFCSTAELTAAIDQYVQANNKTPKPFIWTATAESIFGKLERFCKVTSVMEH